MKFVFKEGNPFSFYGGADDDGRFSFNLFSFVECIEEGFNGVSASLENMPAKGTPFVDNRFNIHYFLHRPVNLQAVVIKKGAEVVNLIMRGGHGGFPDLARLHPA